ncbi:MAG TPA: Na+/H+ antiporter NhaA [Fluviicola sp.]|nr:Na+/H+ antiporter NhaA [Fluviicola sp.]
MSQRSTIVFKKFFESEKSGGIVLIFFTLLSLLIANSSLTNSYSQFWKYELGGMSIEHWINDGLMAIFFLLVGLELKREFVVGELSSLKKASLPVISALGGIFIPAGIYSYLNWGSPTISGYGIPMATDIAFALGALSLLGNKVPVSLKVFLTALAVIDDLGAIIVIAIFYTKTIYWSYLFISLGIFVFLIFCNKIGIKSLWIYLLSGIGMWYFMHHSGIHATITGVLLALSIPTESKTKKESPAEFLQHKLHYPVPFIIMPLFALVNTAISINDDWDKSLFDSASLGIILGLVLGKPFGIFLFTRLSILLKAAEKPKGTTWSQLFGVAILGGIGFTMSIFITLLAFDDVEHINEAKIAILIASIIAGFLGIVWLKASFKKAK